MIAKPIFSGFAEFWSISKFYNDKQRRVILQSLPKLQRERLEEQYVKEGWLDWFMRNELDGILDSIEEEFGVDLLRLRVLVLSGKGVYVNRKFWDYLLTKKFKDYGAKHIQYIFGGYRTTESEYSTDEYRLVPMEGK